MEIIIIGLVIGLIIGFGIAWFLQEKNLTEVQLRLEEKKQEVQQWETVHETRMREMRADLETENQKKLNQKVEELTQQHQAEIQQLEAELAAQKALPSVESGLDYTVSETEPEAEILVLEDLETNEDEDIPVLEDTEIATDEEIAELADHTPIVEAEGEEITEHTIIPVVEDGENLVASDEEIEELTEEIITDEIENAPFPALEDTENIGATNLPEQTEIQSITRLEYQENLVVTETEIEPLTNDYYLEQIELKQELNLSEKILALGASGNSANLLQLRDCIYNSDSQIRSLVAVTIGNIAETCNLRKEIKPTVEILAKLAKDHDNTVRYCAIEALGKMKSAQIIPLLKIAQKDTDPDVVKCASEILNRFKGYSLTAKKSPAKATVKKNRK